MAIYRCEIKNISRGQGRSCVAAAAYRHGEELHDERQDMRHSYSHKHDIQHSEIIAPAGAPAWVNDRAKLWNSIDAAEKRKDARTAKEVLVSLPRELTKERQIEAVREFCRSEFASKGLVADIAVHAPDARDGEKQPHAHIMLSTRALDGEGWAKGKDKSLDQPQGIEAIRERWAIHCNRALERAGLEERVDHRSLADQRQAVLVVAADNARPENERQQAEADAQRLDRSPEPKIGPVALKMERQGRGAEALALRDALEVREERNAKALLVKAWQQVRSDIRDLVNQVADQGDRAPDLLKGFRQAVEKARAGNDSMALEIAEATLGVAEEYQAAGKIPAHHSAAIQKAGQERVFSRLREESASKERPHPHKKEKIDSNGVLEEWSTKKKILLTEYRCRAQKLENSIWCKLKEIGDERRENNYKHNKIKTEEPRGIFGSLKRKSYESAMSAWEIASKNINEWKVIREKELKRRQDIVRQFLGLQTTPLMEQAVTAKLKRREPGLAAQIPKAETEMKRQQEEKRRERLTQRQTKTHQRGKGQGL